MASLWHCTCDTSSWQILNFLSSRLIKSKQALWREKKKVFNKKYTILVNRYLFHECIVLKDARYAYLCMEYTNDICFIFIWNFSRINMILVQWEIWRKCQRDCKCGLRRDGKPRRPHTKHIALINVDFITVFHAHSWPKASLCHSSALLNLRAGKQTVMPAWSSFGKACDLKETTTSKVTKFFIAWLNKTYVNDKLADIYT